HESKDSCRERSPIRVTPRLSTDFGGLCPSKSQRGTRGCLTRGPRGNPGFPREAKRRGDEVVRAASVAPDRNRSRLQIRIFVCPRTAPGTAPCRTNRRLQALIRARAIVLSTSS